MVIFPEKIGHDPLGTAPPAYSQATGALGTSPNESHPYPTPPSSHVYPPVRITSRESQDISPLPPAHIVEPDNPGPPHPTLHQEYFSPYLPQQAHSPTPNTQQPSYNASEAEMVQRGRDYQAMLLAKCAEGQHDYSTSYGIVGIVSAIICFPCGIMGLFIDQERRCLRCRHVAP